MDRLAAMETFVRVIEAGSFAGTAKCPIARRAPSGQDENRPAAASRHASFGVPGKAGVFRCQPTPELC
jgi:hypothetical protein